MINEKLHDLYLHYYGEDYKEKIISGGVVNENAYLSSKPRVIFVLKEAHTKKVGWSIPERLMIQVERGANGFEKNYAYTWNQAGAWAYAIHSGFRDLKELGKPEIIAEGIRTIGMTNLKKTGGGPFAVPKEIQNRAYSDADVWQKEIEIMDPDIIVCGRTYKYVVNILGSRAEKRIKILEDQGKPYHCAMWTINGHNATILQFWHPACRKNRAQLMELLRRLLKNVENTKMNNPI
jgi:hypothetical protein